MHKFPLGMLLSYQIPYGNERAMQTCIGKILEANNIGYIPEHRFCDRDRVDFWIPEQRIALECKVDGGATKVLSQLLRYAEHEQVGSVILVTCRASHRSEMSDLTTLNNKPFSLIWVASL